MFSAYPTVGSPYVLVLEVWRHLEGICLAVGVDGDAFRDPFHVSPVFGASSRNLVVMGFCAL